MMKWSADLVLDYRCKHGITNVKRDYVCKLGVQFFGGGRLRKGAVVAGGA